MTRKVHTQYNFTAGEFSPSVDTRADVKKYANAIRSGKNALINPRGPIQKRNGTVFVKEVKTSADEARLLPFSAVDGTTYALELGNLYMRFYTDGGNIESGGSPIELVTPWDDTEIQDIQYAPFGNKLYISHADHETRVLTYTSSLVWTLAALDAFPPPTEELGFQPVATVTPSATTGITITFTASTGVFLKADIGRQIINQSSDETGKATIVGYTSTTVVTCDIVSDFTNTDAIASGDWKMDLSPIADLDSDGTKIGSIVTVTCDESGGTVAVETFRASDVGKFILMHNGVLEVQTITSASSIKCLVIKSMDSHAETANWSLEEPTWSATRGWPTAIGFFEERLWLGGTATQPQTLWASETGIFDGFGPGAGDSDAIVADLTASALNTIKWIGSGRDLVVGTAGAELTISSGSSAGAITTSAIRQRARTYHGSSSQNPVLVANELLFIQKSNRKIRSFIFDFNTDGFKADDLSFLADHLTEDTLTELAYAQEADSVVYAVTGAGNLIAGTFVREQSVIGWTEFITDGTFEHVTTISNGPADQVWVIVKRTINGSDVRYIEYFDDSSGEDALDRFSDSSLVLDVPLVITNITGANPAVVTSATHGLVNGDEVIIQDVVGMTEVNAIKYVVANKTANTFELTGEDSSAFTAYASAGNAYKLATTISGLDHLEGETVQIKTDNASHPDKTVASGSITLDVASGQVTIGMPYTFTLETLDLDTSVTGGPSTLAQRMRRVRTYLKVYKSIKPVLNGDILPARTPSDPMDEPLPLVTGFLEYGPIDWGQTGRLTITDSQPFPIQITGITGTVDVNVK